MGLRFASHTLPDDDDYDGGLDDDFDEDDEDDDEDDDDDDDEEAEGGYRLALRHVVYVRPMIPGRIRAFHSEG